MPSIHATSTQFDYHLRRSRLPDFVWCSYWRKGHRSWWGGMVRPRHLRGSLSNPVHWSWWVQPHLSTSLMVPDPWLMILNLSPLSFLDLKDFLSNLLSVFRFDPPSIGLGFLSNRRRGNQQKVFLKRQCTSFLFKTRHKLWLFIFSPNPILPLTSTQVQFHFLLPLVYLKHRPPVWDQLPVQIRILMIPLPLLISWRMGE